MLSVVFGLLLLAAAVGVWWLGVRTMEGQSYEDMVWSKFDAACRDGWNRSCMFSPFPPL